MALTPTARRASPRLRVAGVACGIILLYLLAAPGAASAEPDRAIGQQSAPPPAPTPTPAPEPPPDPDRVMNLAEPDFTLGALPTTLRMPRGTFAFRMTHRFTRPLADGTAGDFFADFFGFDGAARIGLELRYGIRAGTQVNVHRTNNRAIQFLGEQSLLSQAAGRPMSLQAIVAVEGADNFSESFATTVGAVVSRQFKDRGAIYTQPLVVFESNPIPELNGLPEYTMLIGFGARFRIASKVYVVAEAAPQVAGYKAGIDHVSVGVERRAGAHLFQLTISNSLGTTMRQVAQGGVRSGDWYIGFNLSRRFF